MTKVIFGIFGKYRHMLVDASELTKALQVLNKLNISCLPSEGNMKVGNCGWAKAPDCWFITFNATNRKYVDILKEFKKNNIHLLPETTGY